MFQNLMGPEGPPPAPEEQAARPTEASALPATAAKARLESCVVVVDMAPPPVSALADDLDAGLRNSCRTGGDLSILQQRDPRRKHLLRPGGLRKSRYRVAVQTDGAATIGRTTLADVAQLAGTSVPTASKVLRGGTDVSPA